MSKGDPALAADCPMTTGDPLATIGMPPGAFATAMIASSDDAIIGKTLAGIVIFWNPAAERIFGYTAAEMLGQPITRLFPEDRLHEEAQLIAQLVTGKPISHFETQRIRKDGAVVDISATLSPVRNAAGSIVAVSKIARDISAWKRLKDQLDQATADLKMIVEHSPGLISYWNGDYTNRFANKAYANAFGLSTEQIRGRHVRDVLGPELYATSSPYIEAARRGEPQSYERQSRLPDGAVRHHQLDYVPDTTSADSRGLFVFMHDVTPRKRGEQALADSAARFQKLYESTPAMMHSIDARGQLLAVSGHWLQKLGYERAEVLGKPLADFLTTASRNKLTTEHLAAFHEGDDYVRLNYQMVCKDGRPIDVVLSAIAERDTEGRFVKGMAVIEDVTARRAAEHALRASEAFLDRAGKIAGVGAWSFDLASKEIYWSSETCRIHGRPVGHKPTLEEVFGYYQGDSRTTLAAAVEECSRTGTPYDLELQLAAADGRQKWVRAVGETELEGGVVVRLCGALQDITDRRIAEEALRRTNERLLLATDAAAIGIWEFDVTRGAFVCDREMHRIYGCTEGWLNSFDRWSATLEADDRAETLRAVERALRGESDYDAEFRVRRPSGEIRHIKAAGRVQRDSGGAPQVMVGINYDITERKKAELALKKTSSLLTMVLDSADLSIIATAPDLTIKVFNKGAERLLGYASAEVVDLVSPMIIHDAGEVASRALELTASLGRPVVGGEVFTDPSTLHLPHEWTYIRKDQCRVPVSVTCSAMVGERGALTGYLAIARDITQTRDHERALRDATARAERANAAKSQFLANMSHEIRTPLNAVIGLGYLLEQSPLGDEQRSFLTKIQFAGRSLLSVVNNVLDLSKVEAGEMILEETAFDIVALAQQLTQMLMSQAQAKGIDLRVRAAADMPRTVRGDATRLQQILTNLLNNAIKFTEFGHVEIELVCVARTTESVRVRCTVSDTGIGISEEGVTRLFTPFAQADASTTRRFGGTGLGLSIARRFAELMGGTIAVTSTIGVGSRFSAELPLRIAQDSEVDVLGVGKRPLQILIAGDPQVSQMLQSIIRPLGWRSHTVERVQDAIVRLRSGQPDSWPDVIILDGALPLGPLKGIARLRAALPDIQLPPIVVVDNEQDGRQCDELRQAGVVLLARSISSSSLFNAVNSAVTLRDGDHYTALQATNFDQVIAQWLAGAQILVVDDSEINRVVAQHIMQKQGATVSMCCNGAEAVDLLRRNRDVFDVVLMDVQMPELDGYEATLKIRSELGLRTLPIIALTAGALVSERERALTAGMDAFLSKPLEPTSLIRVVRRFVEQKRGAPLPVRILDRDKIQVNVANGLASLDGKIVQQMFGKDVALFKSVLSRVIRDFSEFALPAGFDPGEPAARERLAARLHKLRGSVGVISAKTVQRLASAAERALEEGQPPEFVEAILRQLAAAFTTLAEEVRPLLDGLADERSVGADPGVPSAPVTQAVLQQLLDLLDHQNLDAMDQFTAMADSLCVTLGAEKFARLKMAIEELDFAKAAIVVRGDCVPAGALAKAEHRG